jgi:hypothetical protein
VWIGFHVRYSIEAVSTVRVLDEFAVPYCAVTSMVYDAPLVAIDELVFDTPAVANAAPKVPGSAFNWNWLLEARVPVAA